MLFDEGNLRLHGEDRVAQLRSSGESPIGELLQMPKPRKVGAGDVVIPYGALGGHDLYRESIRVRRRHRRFGTRRRRCQRRGRGRGRDDR